MKRSVIGHPGSGSRFPSSGSLSSESPENFVPAITLRTEDYQPIREELENIPGVEVGTRELPLAPTKEFARALLGTVMPATAEQLERLGKGYRVGDEVGQWGLQARFERRLAGTPTRRVVIRARGQSVDAGAEFTQKVQALLGPETVVVEHAGRA